MNAKILILAIGIMLLISNIYALPEIKINVKPNFNVGETAKFSYTISSDKNQDITYLPRIKCTDLPEKMLSPEIIGIDKDNPVLKTYYGFNVTKDIKPQQCLAIIQIQKPFNLIRQEIFQIVNEPLINFYLKLCKDSFCNEESKVFIKGEKVFFNYDSDVKDLIISSKLIFPDGKSQVISIPNNIVFSDIGSYRIEISAYKSGYRNLEIKDEFAIIAKKSIIETIFIRAPLEENQTNWWGGGKIIVGDNYIWIFLLGIVGILIFVVIIIILISIRKKKELSKLGYKDLTIKQNNDKQISKNNK